MHQPCRPCPRRNRVGRLQNPVNLQISPRTAYVQFINHATTGKPDTKPDLNYTAEKINPDGARTITMTGTLPLGKPSEMVAYPVPEPSRFRSEERRVGKEWRAQDSPQRE